MSVRPPADLFDDPDRPSDDMFEKPSVLPPVEPRFATRLEPARIDPRNAAAAASVAAMTDGKLERLDQKRNFQLAPRAISKARAEMDEMSDSGVWTGARGVHLVALYAWLHVAVYGVEAAELDGKTWALASVMAQRFCAANFEGDPAACVEFMRWTWKRETSREEWRRDQKTGGQRLGWRLQFSPSLVTDYRIDQARRS